ncbi:hypothetical protein C8R46DRAFT_1129070, partial [Mycena filopes]
MSFPPLPFISPPPLPSSLAVCSSGVLPVAASSPLSSNLTLGAQVTSPVSPQDLRKLLAHQVGTQTPDPFPLSNSSHPIVKLQDLLLLSPTLKIRLLKPHLLERKCDYLRLQISGLNLCQLWFHLPVFSSGMRMEGRNTGALNGARLSSTTLLA